MANQIVLKHDGKEYTLEFNRRVVKRMEDGGFVIDTNKPYTMITELFRGAFQMHHRRIAPELVEDIWYAQKDKDGLLAALVTMYSEPISALMDEGDGGDDENPTWKMV